MALLQQIFRSHGASYLERFDATLPHVHRTVLAALSTCRTEINGCVLYRCSDCGRPHVAARCCGNRHCPACQQHKGYAWLARQLEHQLPTHYFMLTFTVPAPLREFLRAHQRVGYGALFNASAGAIKQLATEHLGADIPGFFGVLHTWGRCLQYHPHIHYVVPGGAFDSETRRWHACSSGFYLPVPALSIVFRAKFRDAMRAAGLLSEIPTELWNVGWNVNCQAVGEAQASLRYLARYVFKVAISERRIVSLDATHVCLRYRKVNSNRLRTMRLPIIEFMRRFLQHVLPKGFMKVRHYGFLSPSFAMPLTEMKARIEMAQGFAVRTPEPALETPPPMCCRHCGGALRYCAVSRPAPVRAPALTATQFTTTAQFTMNSGGSG